MTKKEQNDTQKPGTGKDKMLIRPTQAETNYTPLSGNLSQLCAGCRWFTGANEGGPYCHLIETWPDDIVATGHCDRWEARPDMAEYSNPLPVIIVDEDDLEKSADKLRDPAVQKWLLEAIQKAQQTDDPEQLEADLSGSDDPTEADTQVPQGGSAQVPAITDDDNKPESHTHPETVEGYIAPDSNKPGIVKSLLNRVTGGLKPGVAVMKAADGDKRMMVIVSSNTYQDRHKQWVSTDAIQKDVARMWAADDSTFMGGVEHLFWHWKELGPVGEIVYSDLWDTFQVDVSREIDDPISFAFFNFVENHPEIDWGASQNFVALKSEDVPGGTFSRIRSRERSTLPREDAANLLTFTGVLPMPTKRQEFLNKMVEETYGVKDFSSLMEKGLAEAKAELAKNGAVSKGADKQDESVDFAPLVLKMAESQAAMFEQIETLTETVTGVTDKQKSLEDEALTELQGTVKSLGEAVDEVRKQLSLAPRSVRQSADVAKSNGTAGEDGETLTLEEIQKLKESLPGGDQIDDFWGDTGVPASN